MAQVIRSLKDPVAINFMRLSTEKKLRYSWKKCILTSGPLIDELSRRFTFEDVIVDRKSRSTSNLKYKSFYVMTPKLVERIGQLKNAGLGVLATLPIPSPVSLEVFDSKRVLILDGITDNGELGTIIRSASAFDWDSVWITHSCADPFDPISIRSSQGALFDLPYRVGSIENALKYARRSPETLRLKLSIDMHPNSRIGITGPELSESKMGAPANGTVCLLIQRSVDTSPGVTDFRSVNIGGVTDPRQLPLSVSASSVLYAIRDRYFS